MLNRLQLFRNIGQFDSATAANVPLSRLTLVYAENGRGKTTLAANLRSLATGNPLPIAERRRLTAANPPHVAIDCTGGPPAAVFQNGAWNRTVRDMVIFDDTFIDENVCSGLVVESEHRQKLHELILGSQGVALSRTLETIIAQIEQHNRVLREKADAIPVNVRGGLSVDDFCALPERSDIDDAIRDAERNLAAAREQDSIRNTREFEAFGLPAIDVASISALLARNLPDLDRAAAEHVQRHIATLGEAGEDWVASGVRRIQGDIASVAGKPCPFCAQDLSGSAIIAHYRSYFGDAYARLKQEVLDTSRTLEDQYGRVAAVSFERSIRQASERRLFWSRFADVPELDIDLIEVTRVWGEVGEALIAELRRKQNAPLEPIEFAAETRTILSEYEQARAQVLALSDRLLQANSAIRLVKEQASTGNVALLEADVARLKATKVRHTAQIRPLCEAYLEEIIAKAVREQERDAARAALDQYRRAAFPAYQSAINEYLRKFNAGFRLDRVTSQNIRGGSACTYNVLINNQPIAVSGAEPGPGEPSFRNVLSAGDRNTLALAVFFASLDRDANLASKIVIIDDPISSLDEHRSLTTVQEVRRLMQRTAQVIVLSHNKPFLCNIWDQTDTTLRGAVEIARDGDGSIIRAWDVNRDMVTEHDRRHELLRSYVAAATPQNREVAHSIRPVLEAFLRVAYPEQFPPGTLLGPFRGLCEQRVGTGSQILSQPDIDELRDITEYANLFHHDTNPAWQAQRINDAELLNFVQRTLAFTRR